MSRKILAIRVGTVDKYGGSMGSKFLDDTVSNKTCVVVGTRPGIIKMSPLIQELEERDVESFTIHAGQHYSHSLDGQMFEDLRLDKPKHRVEGMEELSGHGEQTARMLSGIEEVLLEEKPENILVCGDANFNLAGALAGRKLRLNVGHVEAGLRSNDWRMPEEHNRVMIDHISDYLFVPTEEALENVKEEKCKGEAVLTGNTIVDAVERNIEIAEKESTVLNNLVNGREDYVLFTAHREENVDDPEILEKLVVIMEKITNKMDKPVIYPVHPRTKKRFDQYSLNDRLDEIQDLILTEPLGYLDFLKLLKNADIVLTDSGGIQEESCILETPCVTLRENTERPETVELGMNVIAGTEPKRVLKHTERMTDKNIDWKNPFGDGKASQKIIDSITQ